jgi:hypothetical protein
MCCTRLVCPKLSRKVNSIRRRLPSLRSARNSGDVPMRPVGQTENNQTLVRMRIIVICSIVTVMHGRTITTEAERVQTASASAFPHRLPTRLRSSEVAFASFGPWTTALFMISVYLRVPNNYIRLLFNFISTLQLRGQSQRKRK